MERKKQNKTKNTFKLEFIPSKHIFQTQRWRDTIIYTKDKKKSQWHTSTKKILRNFLKQKLNNIRWKYGST